MQRVQVAGGPSPSWLGTAKSDTHASSIRIMKHAGVALFIVSTMALAGCGGSGGGDASAPHTSASKTSPAKAAAPVTLTANAPIDTAQLATYFQQHGQAANDAAQDAKYVRTACDAMSNGKPVTTATAATDSLDTVRGDLVADTIVKTCPASVASVPFFADGESYDTMPAVPTRIAAGMKALLDS